MHGHQLPQSRPAIVVRVNGVVKTGAGHTNLGDPLDAAREMLQTQGRSDVPDIIIFMTDGEANQPDTPAAVQLPEQQGDDREGRRSDDLHDRLRRRRAPAARGTPAGPSATRTPARTSPGLRDQLRIDDVPGGCGINENKDGDYYFCESGSGDLEPVFRQVAAATLGHSRLIEDL